MRAGGGDIGGNRRERQGQIRERGVRTQDAGDDGGVPGAGEQVRLRALQGARLCEQVTGKYVSRVMRAQ